MTSSSTYMLLCMIDNVYIVGISNINWLSTHINCVKLKWKIVHTHYESVWVNIYGATTETGDV